MCDRVRAVRKIPFLKDSVDKSAVLQEVKFEEFKKNLIRNETLGVEPRAEQGLHKLVTRLDDPSKPWYIVHV